MRKELVRLDMRIYVDVEEWKDCTFPRIRRNYYMISNFGRVMRKSDGYIVKLSKHKEGYMRATLRTGTSGCGDTKIHRLVAYEFCNGKDVDIDILVVNHKDSCRHNNYYKNLEWVSTKENSIHAYESGYGQYGENHHSTKFTEDIVHCLCRILSDGVSNQADIYERLIREIDCSRYNRKQITNLIIHVRLRRLWNHINKLYKY